MSEKLNNDLDKFSSLIRDMVEDHQLPVSDNCWQDIESGLAPKPKKNIYYISVILSVAAAVLLFILLYPYNISEPKVTEYANTEDIQRDSPVVKDNSDLPATVNKNFISEKVKTKLKIKKYTLIPDESSIPDVYADIVIKEKDSTKQNNPAESHQKNVSDFSDFLPPAGSIDNMSTIYKNKNDEWQFIASLGAGNNSFYSEKRRFSMLSVNSPMKENPGCHMSNKLLKDDYSDVKYSFPVSFGVYVRKNLSDIIAVETGLVYTYLSSEFQKKIIGNSTATLRLHYLGVPANVVFRIWDNKKWGVHFSTGGMVEKGLRSNYYEQKGGGKKTIQYNKSNINGLQWSVGASVGLSYRLTDRFNLFVEPKVSYYFNNDQPPSIRTHKPTVVGLNGGIRFDL